MNKKRKGYIDLDDIKKINSSLSNLFTEEDLEGKKNKIIYFFINKNSSC